MSLFGLCCCGNGLRSFKAVLAFQTRYGRPQLGDGQTDVQDRQFYRTANLFQTGFYIYNGDPGNPGNFHYSLGLQYTLRAEDSALIYKSIASSGFPAGVFPNWFQHTQAPSFISPTKLTWHGDAGPVQGMTTELRLSDPMSIADTEALCDSLLDVPFPGPNRHVIQRSYRSQNPFTIFPPQLGGYPISTYNAGIGDWFPISIALNEATLVTGPPILDEVDLGDIGEQMPFTTWNPELFGGVEFSRYLGAWGKQKLSFPDVKTNTGHCISDAYFGQTAQNLNRCFGMTNPTPGLRVDPPPLIIDPAIDPTTAQGGCTCLRTVVFGGHPSPGNTCPCRDANGVPVS